MTDTIFNTIVVIGEETMASMPMYEQVQAKLLHTIQQNPRYRLAPDASISTMKAPSLPEETKGAVEPVIWSLQERFDRRGGEWQVDFFSPLGFSFMVVYLE